MLAEKLMWLGYPPGTHSMSLKSAGELYCNVELDKSVRGKIITVGITEETIVYAANDVKYEISIYNKQQELLKEKDLLDAVKFENEFVKVLAYIEYCGVKLDVPRWKAKMEKDQALYNKTLKELNNWLVNYYKEHSGKKMYIKQEFLYDTTFIHFGDKDSDIIGIINPNSIKKYEVIDRRVEQFTEEEFIKYNLKGSKYYVICKVPFPYIKIDTQGDLFTGFNTEPQCIINWKSSKQVIPLFEMLGFNLITFDKKTKEKKKSVESKIIEPQINISSIAPLYLAYKAAAKTIESFGQNFLDAITTEDGRIHADFYQLQDTGRISCGGGESGINLQQIPSEAETRACFISEEGNKWISIDYDGQESHILADVSGDASMIELFKHGCGDVHSLVAKMSYPNIIKDTRIEEIKHKFHQQRQDAKGIEFAINPIYLI